MEHILYWLWLTAVKQIRPSKIKLLLDELGNIENIYFLKNFNDIRCLSQNDKTQLENKDLRKAEYILEIISQLKAKIIVYDDENYPQILKNISDPPYVLYIQGKVPELDKVLTIGVVGTRRATEFGIKVTERFCYNLAREGVVTVSGLALGIDAASAWATIKAGGIAVAVLGNGLDIVYPHANAELYSALAQYGCIMTEYPPSSPPIGSHFPARNRIIAGLSRGVLVTEAPRKSGSLITARFAMENNRDVFAVPRDISRTELLGTNIIIQEGAKLVNSPKDILCEYPYFEKVPPVKYEIIQTEINEYRVSSKSEDREIDLDGLNDGEKSIAKLLQNSDMQVDELSRKLEIPVSEISVQLTMLEMKGIVKKLGNQYSLKM